MAGQVVLQIERLLEALPAAGPGAGEEALVFVSSSRKEWEKRKGVKNHNQNKTKQTTYKYLI